MNTALTSMDEASIKVLTQLELIERFAETDQALEASGAHFVGSYTFGHDLTDYNTPMLLPKSVHSFVNQNAQTVKTAEVRPNFDNTGLASLVFGLSSETQIIIEGNADAPAVQARHVNRHGQQREVGWTTNAEIIKFLSGLSMCPETRKKFALMPPGPENPFTKFVTKPDYWSLTSEAVEDSADYTIFERTYNLLLEEIDRDTFFSTRYSGIFSTQQRPTSRSYSLALKSVRELEDRIKVTDMKATVNISEDALPEERKIATTVNGETRVIIPGEAAQPPASCNKPAVANFILGFLRKATPVMPELDIRYQRGLPDVADPAPGVDEY